MAEPSDKPKIIVDSDWKAEAQREKEELDRKAREAPGPGELPPPSLLEIVQMIVMQASVSLGGYQDPSGHNMPPNLPMAKHFIDLLDLFHQKSAAGLDPQEKQIIEATLHELRMAFVEHVTGGGEPPAAAGGPGQA